MCVPLLANKAPPGWTISLVDNPGFGEAKEHVTQLAEASVITSSAYIYLMQSGDIGGKEAAEFFKDLNKKDKGNVQNRHNYIVCHFQDHIYSSSHQISCF